MDLLLTSALHDFLVDEGYTHYLSNKLITTGSAPTLVPIRFKPSSEQCQKSLGFLVNNSQLSRFTCEDPNKQVVSIKMEKNLFVAYICRMLKCQNNK